MKALVVDLFAGGGGASVGIEAALDGHVDIAINHDPIAIAVHKANHPNTTHLTASIWDVDPVEACGGHPVLFLHASPDCTHFSRAKGSKPRRQDIRSLADVVIVWAEKKRPLVITLENVPEFVEWGPLGADDKPIKERKGETFKAWTAKLRALGYELDHRVLDASHYGAPTKRRRFFLVARRDRQPIRWPEATHGAPPLQPFHTAAECIDWSIPCPSIFGRKKPLAENTQRRIAMGIKKYVIDDPNPFIVPIEGGYAAPTLIQTGYGERKGQRPRYLDIHEPLGTQVAQGVKHALAVAFFAKHFGGHMTPGIRADGPLSAITAKDHHALVTATLGFGSRAAEVRAFLTVFYGNPADVGQSLHDPARTLTTKDRLGLVTVAGHDLEICDVGMRMLKPDPELKRAQFGRFADGYDLSAARTESAKTRLIGNSVPPEVIEALVRANLPAPLLRRAA